MDDEQKSLSPASSGDIVPVNQLVSSLDPIQASLYEKMRLGETPEEVQSYLNLIKQREEQIEQIEYSNFQLSESKNQIRYERKIAVYRETIASVFSIISVILGILVTSSMPLVAPLLIVFGLIKPLGYSIGEVVELFRGLTEARKLPQGETTEKKQTPSESSE